jgi:YidC/Oxa1 family membrane protein insertase
MVDPPATGTRPLAARFASDGGKPEDDTGVVYTPDRDALTLSGPTTDTLTLTGALASGARITKAFTFRGDAYPIGVVVSSADRGHSQIGLSWRHRLATNGGTDPEAAYRGAVVLADRKVKHELVHSLVGQPPVRFDPPVGWAGYNDHYFLAALVPESPARGSTQVSADERSIQVLVNEASGGETEAQAPFTLYVGPKDVEVLESVGHQLSRAVDFGWFAMLALPLLRLLKFFNGFTRNYGVDIILLTILVKVLFIPLSNKSMKSMREMQRLQPQMAKLRDKFKDDRERLNREMIELYRRHRVNPLGGCLPMLLQFPVFIGLYQALNQSIELRHAHFAMWVRDLSAYECYPWPGQAATVGCNELSLLGMPIPVLVILMGASMILQQWVSPSTGMDPAQQRMMMILMPIMFTVMFVNFPSGLVLYWLVNNVLTIAQQWWTNRSQA